MLKFDINDNSVWMSDSVSSTVQLLEDESYQAKMEKLCMLVQGELCRKMEELEDGKVKFFVDKWDRKAGGGGISCVLSDGNVFEKVGVNISRITGTLSRPAVLQMKARIKDLVEDTEYPFFACGISCVAHPRNPHVPACHFNFRYFELIKPSGESNWWFGGGSDLTPNFYNEQDARHFHTILKEACDRHNPNYYRDFKEWCDRYFVITHRGECRGVGGIFFDDLDTPNQQAVFEFVQDCAMNIKNAYIPLVENHMNDSYSDEDREWQLVRRGRYVEFNLVYDRGTKFGLATPEARIESILMSLPLLAKWVYRHEVGDDPRKTKLMEVLKNPVEWVD